MPTTNRAYDAQRIEILLDDLWNRTRREAGFVNLELKSLPRTRLTGTATRAGLLRLGVEIARESQRAETEIVTINADGWVNTTGRNLIDMLLVDENVVEKPNPSSAAFNVGCSIAIALFMFFAVVGLWTVITWIENWAT